MIAQLIAVLIFVGMFILMISEKVERHIVTLGSGILVLIFVFGVGMHSRAAMMEILNLHSIFSVDFWYQTHEVSESLIGINWATIFFIAGMMVMVEGMAKVGFFRWLCMRIGQIVHFKTIPLFITFMIMSAILAMFIDSITVILFLAAVTVELARMLKFNPVPMIISEIFCANLGGSATMCGDPPNIIIGTSLGYTFADFITNTGLIAAVSLVVTILYFYFYFRKELQPAEKYRDDRVNIPGAREMITDKKGFAISCVIFLCVVIMLITHAQTGLTVAFIGVFAAVVTLLAARKTAVGLLKDIDYKTLLFFIGLFIVVGGLEETGILESIAGFISRISGGNHKLMTAIIIWVSAVASAIVDNIPFAATMLPVIKSLSQSQGIALPILVWALSMGTDIGGSATPIGASANVVGTSVAAREGYLIGWGRYCKAAIPATILVLLVSTIIIFIRYF